MRFATASLCLIVFCHSELPAEPASVPASTRGSAQCEVRQEAGSPTWHDIGVQYARLAHAIRRKDFDAMVELYAPSFDVNMKGELPGNGEVWNREKSLAVQKERLDSVTRTRLISNTITQLRDCGDRAVATVIQQWYRTQNVDGVLRNIETVAVQDEEWIKTEDGWRRGNIGNIHLGATLVDNKRIDSSKPYRPNDPPFEPYAETSGGRR